MGNEFGLRDELLPSIEVACHDFAVHGHESTNLGDQREG